MDIKKLKAEFEKLKYIEEKLEYLNFDEHLGCYVEKNNGMPVGLAAWVNGAFYGFNQAAKAQAVPEGFVLVEASELESLKSDNEYFTKSCIDWTERAYKQRAKVDQIKNEVERFKQSGTSLDLGRFLDNLIEFSTFKHDAEFDGFVLVSMDRLTNVVNGIEALFEEDPTLALGELLPIQQDLKDMIEAQEPAND